MLLLFTLNLTAAVVVVEPPVVEPPIEPYQQRDGSYSSKLGGTRKGVPARVKKVVYDLIEFEVNSKKPIEDLKAALKALDIKYEKAYGEFLRQVLIVAKKEAEEAEEETIMLLLMHF